MPPQQPSKSVSVCHWHMIEDREFWRAAVDGSPHGKLALNALAVVLHRASATTCSSSKGSIPGSWLRHPSSRADLPQATAAIVPSPTAVTPTSAGTHTPTVNNNSSPQSTRARDPGMTTVALDPNAGLHEPLYIDGSGDGTLHRTASSPSAKTPNGGSALCRKSSTKEKRGAATGNSKRQAGPFDGCSRISEGVVRLLQHTMMFLAPMHTWRYRIPAMSMSFNTSCVVDAETRRLITFGVQTASVPIDIRCSGCVAGDTFIAIVSDKNEVWISGSLESGNGSIAPTTDNMRGIATKVISISGHGSRLLALSKAYIVRPLSTVSVSTRNMFPSRLVRYLDVGFGDDCYMIGVDSSVYKTTINQRSVTTPRRVMPLSCVPLCRVVSGMGFHLFIDEAGRVYSMGKNKHGQLGNGQRQDSMRRPHLVETLMRHYVIQVAAGEGHSLALTCAGDVYGSGSNEFGQLGLGANVPEVCTMTRIPLPEKCVGIAAGPMGSMFALASGALAACGANGDGQLGLPPPDATNGAGTFVTVPRIVAGVQSVFINEVDMSAPTAPLASPADSVGFMLNNSSVKGATISSAGSNFGTPAGSNAPPKAKPLCNRCCSLM